MANITTLDAFIFRTNFKKAVKEIFNNPIAGFIALILVSLSPFYGIGSGYDYLVHYHDVFSIGFGVDTWWPYWGYWILYPFTLLSPVLGLFLWNVTNAIGVGLLAKKSQINLFYLAFSFPVFYMLGNGQVEGILAFGVLLGLSGNPILVGLGLVILSIKPQVTGLLALWIVWKNKDYRDFIIPLVTVLISFAIHGMWVDNWILSILNKGDYLNNVGWNISLLFPYSLVLLPLLYMFRKDFRAMLVLPAILMPYYAFYSLSLPIAVAQKAYFWLFALLWSLSLIFVLTAYPSLALYPWILLVLVYLTRQAE